MLNFNPVIALLFTRKEKSEKVLFELHSLSRNGVSLLCRLLLIYLRKSQYFTVDLPQIQRTLSDEEA